MSWTRSQQLLFHSLVTPERTILIPGQPPVAKVTVTGLQVDDTNPDYMMICFSNKVVARVHHEHIGHLVETDTG